ncbi:MAG: amidohydrolase [Pseudomonadota bacterium]
MAINTFSKAMRFGPLLFLVVLTACERATRPEPADTVFKNAKVYLGKVEERWASEIAVKDGVFSYVGNDASAHTGVTTIVYDLAGRTVLPGLIDGHAHPGIVSMSEGQVVLGTATTEAELLAEIRKTVSSYPDREFLLGGFWSNQIFGPDGPHKEALDAIEPDRPLILYDDWAHTIWVNSMALKKAGVTRDTKDIVPGFSFYKKDDAGEPTGWITESATSVFLTNFLSVTEDTEKALLEYLHYFRSVGVTTLLDAGNFGLDRDVYAAISRLDRAGKLPIRYHGAYTLFTPDGLPHAVQTLKTLGEEFNSKNVQIDTLKVFFDGVIETRTAAVSSDYLDTPGNSGEALLNRDQVTQLILDLEEEGLNFHAHSVGDRSTTILLDGIEGAHKALGRQPNIRVSMCHLELIKETDFPRFRKLGVVANFTPHWAVGGDLSWMTAGVGEKAQRMQRSQPLIADGAIVSFSSDNTDSGEWRSEREASSPFVGMQVGRTRQDIGSGVDDEYLPPLSERLRISDLVNGYTSNAAYQLGIEDTSGSIAVGMRADLLVLNQDLFEVDQYDIHKTKPLAVWMDGDLVYGDLSSMGLGDSM